MSPPRPVRTLAFAVLTALSAGTNYVFSVYGPQVAAQLHLSATALNVVSASGNAGVYLSGPLVGVVVDRRGPRPVLLVASGCLLVGYLGMYTLYTSGVDGWYATVGLPGLAICQILTGMGGSGASAAAVKSTSLTFSKASRGAAMATVLSGFGLSAFLYSALSHANLFSTEDPTSGFLLTLAFGCGFSVLLGALFIPTPPPAHAHNLTSSPSPAHTSQVPYVSISHYDDPTDDDDADHFRPSHDPNASEYSLHATPSHGGMPMRAPSPGVPSRPSSRARQRSTSPLLRKEREEDEQHEAGDLNVSGMELLRQKDFWALFVFLGLCSGVGLMYINNLGTVILTLASADGADPDLKSVAASQAYLVSLLSLMNCAGRLTVGFSSDLSTHHAPLKLRFARIWWIVITALLFVLSQLLASQVDRITGVRGLALPTVLTGFAYGFLFGSTPVVCLERFGLSNYSANFGYLTLSPAVLANLTNLAFGAIYDAHVALSPSSPPSLESLTGPSLSERAASAAPAHLCTLGRACFAQAFQLTTAMSVAAVAIALGLSMRKSFKPSYGGRGGRA
ncbi:hypothetical protein JCM8097_000817 [Rhodosporidiobolus ruineniae]